MRAPLLRASASDVNLWKIPLSLSLASCALFAVTVALDACDATGLIHLPAWITMGSIDDARAILGAMLSCVSTVLALIFSVSLLVLSMVATLFGPRLLQRFLKDWVTQVTIGLFMGTFVYLCLVFLVTHQDSHSTFVPQISLLTSWVLVVGSFGFLVFYSHRIATSIQNPDLIARIVDEFAPALAEVRPPGGAEAVDGDAPARAMHDGGELRSARSGYVQEIDHRGLVADATDAAAVVHLVHRPGQFVLQGEPLAWVTPAERAEQLRGSLQRCVQIGRHRSRAQDFEFGVAQIVEIAIRALSPAVNDTFTGVACVDWLGEALLLAARSLPSGGTWRGDDGGARLTVPPLRMARVIRLAFDQIRQAASDNPAVLIRILEMVARLRPRVGDEASTRALLDEADAVREAATRAVPSALDRADVEAAWRRTQSEPGAEAAGPT